MHRPNFNRQRQRMVNGALRDRGIRDQSVLDAMNQVSREEFVPEDLRESAYHDCALPIGSGQTISQPFIVALMTEALPEDCGQMQSARIRSNMQLTTPEERG